MSFFDFLDRMVQGKPVFDANDKTSEQHKNTVQPPAQSQEAEKPSGPVIRKGDESSFPVAYIKHATTHFNGNKMQVYCQIVNKWPEEIMLDKIHIFGATREIDNFLQGNHEHEFLVYDGPKLQKQDYHAQLDYKTREEGDYFEAIHDVTFMYHEEDKTYSVNEIRLHLPIRDIYG
jgi:hypothetical protein